MRRIGRWLLWLVAVIVLVPVLAAAVVLGLLNTGFGQHLVETQAASLTGGMVAMQGISGSFPAAPRIRRIELRDAQGTWLVIEDAALDWTPLRLLGRVAEVQRLSARRVAVMRQPVNASTASTGGGGSFQLPVQVDVRALHVDRVELAASVAGFAADAALDGSAHVVSLQQGDAELTLRALDSGSGAGVYHARGHIDPAMLRAALDVTEAAGGAIAKAARLPGDVGAIDLHATAEGPWTAVATALDLAAGPLRAAAHGTIDVTHSAADLDIAVHAPAMSPVAGVAFKSLALTTHVAGPFARPDATGHLDLDGLEAGGAALRHLAADLRGSRGAVSLKATATGLRLPGPQPGLLEAGPLLLAGEVRLDQPNRPVAFSLTHPLLAVHGTADTGGAIQVKAHLDLPDLRPLAAMGGVDLAGHGAFDVAAATGGGTENLTLDGTLGITGGPAPVPALIGPDASLGVSAALHDGDVTVSRFELTGHSLNLSAKGGLVARRLDLATTIALADLHDAAPTLAGNATLTAHAAGPLDALAAEADLAGDIATTGVARGHVTASVRATGLPGTPAGTVTASGMLDGAPVELAAAAQRGADGATRIDIQRGEWKSAHVQGQLTLASGASLPLGHVELRMTSLDDLRRLTGKALTGSVEAVADLTEAAGHTTAQASLRAVHAGLPGTASVGLATLDARVLDPLGAMSVDAKLVARGVQASGVSADARASVFGPRDALAIRASLTANTHAAGPATASASAVLDLPARTVALSAFEATAKGAALRLLTPARVSFGDTVAVDRLRLGVGGALLDIAGRVSPTLDVTASLDHATADLARIAAPDLQASGTLSARARLTGSLARPAGTVHLTATGLRMRGGPAASLPPASVTADATLAGATAQLNAELRLGRNDLRLTGTAPIDPGARMDLRAAGGIDLTLLDPVLSATGRRVRGQLAVDAAATGTLSAPSVAGTLRLTGGEVQDFAQGARIDHIDGLLQAVGQSIVIQHLNARAGEGTIAVTGSLGVAAPMPVDLHLVMRHAKPLASDKLTAVLDSDLALRGALQGALAASGRITIDGAEIRVPEQLPVSLATLVVRRPGDKPPPPAAPGPDVSLDLTLNAPGQIFVRGRGLDAELEGSFHIGGTASAPRPDGTFKLRHGIFSLAGQTLTFTSGQVGFDGSGRLDPTLNFVATSNSGNFVATLTIGGYASNPKITLSSVPEAPQDEVLARLLFGQSAASLGPFQLAQIAAALAQMTTGAGSSFDPLGAVRQGLGLDRLSVGGGGGGTSSMVEAGKYVARGVYVGAKQSTSGNGTQATVQVDLTKRLKLETAVGTGGGSATGAAASTQSTGTSIGLTYQFEY